MNQNSLRRRLSVAEELCEMKKKKGKKLHGAVGEDRSQEHWFGWKLIPGYKQGWNVINRTVRKLTWL